MPKESKMRIFIATVCKWVIKNTYLSAICISILLGSSLGISKEYDLKSLQLEAIQNNFQVSSLKNKIEIEIINSEIESLERYLPKMGLTVGYVHRSKRLSSPPDEIAYLYLNYNIFNGFKDKYNQEVSDLNIKKQRIGLSYEIRRIKKEVEKKYYEVLSTLSLIKIETSYLNQIAKTSTLAQKLFAAGTVPKSDFLAMEILTEDLKAKVWRLNQRLSQDKIELARIIGLQNDDPISVSGSVPSIYLTTQIDQEKILKKLKINSDPLKQSELDRTISQKRMLRSKYKWLPRIDIESKYGRLAEDYEKDNDVKNEVSILLTFDFFSGLQSFWEKRQRLLELENTDNSLNLIFNDMRYQLKQKIVSLESLQNKMDLILNQNIRIEKFYESLLIEYKKGIKSLGDLSDAQEKVFESLVRKEEINLQMLNIKIDIELLTGENIENFKLAKEVKND